MFFKKKEKNLDNLQKQEKKIAQEWLPFSDVEGNFIIRKDGSIVIALKIEPMNISLKSKREKRQIIQSIHEAWNGQLDPLQIVSLPRPVDLDHYFLTLQEKVKDTSEPKKRRLLQEYIQYVAGVVRSGEAVERRYYMLLSQKNSRSARQEILQRGRELVSDLETSGLEVKIADDREVLDMLFSFLQPAQAAFEEIPFFDPISTVFRG